MRRRAQSVARAVAPRITYANVVATLALFVALGGSSYAAVKIGSTQIKDNSIKSKDVKNRSLLSRDFKSGQLPKGSKGSQGPTGPQGPQGATNVTVRSVLSTCTQGACGGVFTKTANCQPGERAVGGGAALIGNGGQLVFTDGDKVVASGPSDTDATYQGAGTPTGWTTSLQTANAPTSRFHRFTVVCASP
jgi:hypothetical protein